MSRKKESPLDIELHQACKLGDAKRVQQILDTGRVHVDCQDDEDGTSPLMLAIIGHHPSCISALLREGADPNVRRKDGIGPLMLASQLGFPGVLRELIQHGADVDAINQWGCLEIVQILMEKGCNIHKAMQDGTTALFLAAQAGHSSLVSALIAECERRHRNVGILVAAPRKDGASPLFIAAQMGNLECVRRLLECGAEVDQSRIDDVTPLFKACHKGHLEVMKELLKFNAHVGVLQNGESCLHAAAMSDNPLVAKMLLNLGNPDVNPSVRNRDGKTALDLANEAGHEDTAKLIKSAMITSAVNTSKSSLSCSSSDRESSPKQNQHVRFKLNEGSIQARATSSGLEQTPMRVQCKILQAEEMLREAKSPVRMVWRNAHTEAPRQQWLDKNEPSKFSSGRTH